MRGYISQMRQELVARLLSRVYADGTGKPSKVRNLAAPLRACVISVLFLLLPRLILISHMAVVAEFHQEEVHGQELLRWWREHVTF